MSTSCIVVASLLFHMIVIPVVGTSQISFSYQVVNTWTLNLQFLQVDSSCYLPECKLNHDYSSSLRWNGIAFWTVNRYLYIIVFFFCKVCVSQSIKPQQRNRRNLHRRMVSVAMKITGTQVAVWYGSLEMQTILFCIRQLDSTPDILDATRLMCHMNWNWNMANTKGGSWLI